MASSPTLRRRRLAARLRELRAEGEHDTADVATHLGCKSPKVSRIENGHRMAAIGDVMLMLQFYGVTGEEQDRLMQLARDARKRGWWQDYDVHEDYATYVGLEAEAASVRTYQGEVIPALLQTPDYARALIRAGLITGTEDEIDRQVELRLRRQERLRGDAGDTALDLWVVINEAALRRPMNGPDAHRAQLRHLVEMAELPNVTVQVLPFSAGAHPATGGPFVLIEFPEQIDPDVVHLETQVGAMWLEEPAQVQRYARMMDHMRALAADPARSVAFIEHVAKEAT